MSRYGYNHDNNALKDFIQFTFGPTLVQPARQRKKGTTLHLSEFAGEAAGSLAAHKKREAAAAADWVAGGGGGAGDGGSLGFDDILEGGLANGAGYTGGEVGAWRRCGGRGVLG